jgi:spermidine synthase
VTLLPAVNGRAWVGALAALLALLGWWRAQPPWRAFHLRQIYWRPAFRGWGALARDLSLVDRLAVPTRRRTAYQWIDLVPENFSARVQGPNPYLLFLNRNLQFSAESFKRYHQSMVHGAVDLLRREPSRVLILGGGDGLLLPELLKYRSIESIDLVELDPAMLELARHDPELLLLNQGSLADPRVNVHVEDAFQFVRLVHFPYDLILIDLPYPRSYELSPLFSREFYAFVHARLAGDGLMAMDFPPPERGPRAFAVVLHSLRAAGFNGLTAFGDEEVFVVARHEPGPRDFRFRELDRHIADQTVLNLFSRQTEVDAALAAPAPVNSVLFPLRFDRLDTQTPRVSGSVRWQGGAGPLPLFFERFRRFQQTHFMEAAWPPAMMRYWEQSLGEQRDLEEEIAPGWAWPRFSWRREFEGGGARGSSTLIWVDTKTPERLRAAWRAAFTRAPAGDWRAVAWRPGGDTDEAVFYFMETPSEWRGRRLNGGAEERVVFHRDGRGFEVFRGDRLLWRGEEARQLMYEDYQTDLARMQFDLKRDFFLLPRHYADSPDHSKRLLYYP